MDLKEIAQIFNKAFINSFNLKRSFVAFLILLLSGLSFLLLQTVAIHSFLWMKLFLISSSFFIVIWVMMSGGPVLIRLYTKEKSNEKYDFPASILQFKDLIFRPLYIILPVVLAFFIFCLFSIFCFLLKSIPYVGVLFGIVLAFAPFIFNFSIIMLFLASLAALFFLSPVFACQENLDLMGLFNSIRRDFFSSLFLSATAYFSLFVIWKVLVAAMKISLQLYTCGDGVVEYFLCSLVMMIPFLIVMTPALVFFFIFAYESHRWLIGRDIKK